MFVWCARGGVGVCRWRIGVMMRGFCLQAEVEGMVLTEGQRWGRGSFIFKRVRVFGCGGLMVYGLGGLVWYWV